MAAQENVQQKCRNPASVTLTCPSGTFFRGVIQVFSRESFFTI